MRFLHLVQRYHPAMGGSEWYMRMISEGLVAKGHSVEVLTTTALDVDSLWRSDYAHVVGAIHESPTHEEINGVVVHRVKPRYLPFHGKAMTLLSFVPILSFKGRFAMPGPLLPSIDELAKLVGDCDLVHATALPFTPILWAAYQVAKRKNAKLIYSPFMHLAIPDRLGYGYRKSYQIEILNKADRVIAQTNIERDALTGMGVDASKIRIMGLGIDPDPQPKGDAERFRKRYGLDGPIVFNLSARTFDKGAIHVVDAMKKLWDVGAPLAAPPHLVMAGPARPDYVAHVAALPENVRSRILDLGVIEGETKADLFEAGDVFAMPSRSESFGIVYLESWRSGKPVIAARAGAVPEVIADGEDGLLVDFGDVPALANAIERLLTDVELRKKMGEAGRKKVLDKYRWEDKFSAYIDIIAELISGA